MSFNNVISPRMKAFNKLLFEHEQALKQWNSEESIKTRQELRNFVNNLRPAKREMRVK